MREKPVIDFTKRNWNKIVAAELRSPNVSQERKTAICKEIARVGKLALDDLDAGAQA